MRNFSLMALCFLGLAGCAATGPYGNFTQNPAEYDAKLATDAVRQIRALYPPATTRFNLYRSTPDPFGTALAEALRAQGYALSEFKPGWQIGLPAEQDKRQQAPGLTLRYVIDQSPGTNLYRVMVLIGQQSLTRAYLASNHGLYPAGAWVRKE